MLFRNSIKQAFRTPVRLTSYFLVIALVSAFLCIGLNMKRAADDNLEKVLNDFNVLALPDFKANIDAKGNRVERQNSIGYFQCYADEDILTALQQLPGVRKIDARNRFGACMDGAYQILVNRTLGGHYESGYDVVIFRLKEKEPVILDPAKWSADGKTKIPPFYHTLNVELLWSASGSNLKQDRLRFGKQHYGTYVLEPGKTYIINITEFENVDGDFYHYSDQLTVNGKGAYYWKEDQTSLMNRPLYSPIMEYYDGFWETDAGHYFRQAAEACYLASNSFNALTTGDVSLIPAFAGGQVYLKEGRLFTEEDYMNGNKVCLVSDHFLECSGYQIGDIIDFSFYPAQYILNYNQRDQISFYDPHLFVEDKQSIRNGTDGDFPLNHIFDENTYTIIGTYDGKVAWRDDHESYKQNESMLWLTVIFPEKSIENQPPVKLSQYTTTIKVEPLMLQKFLAAAQSSGLMDEQAYGYQLGLTIDDHGLLEMISGLEALQQVSRLALMLSAITAALAVAVLSILHLLQNRRQMAVLRSLGMRKGQAVAWLICGVLLISLLASSCGAMLGEKLSAKATESIIATAQEDTMDSSFSAMLATDTEDSEDDFQLTTATDPAITKQSTALVFGGLLLCMTILFTIEAHKPPLLMLGVKE